eukprot:2600525-Alexandrium_andersonii.AAC.1
MTPPRCASPELIPRETAREVHGTSAAPATSYCPRLHSARTPLAAVPKRARALCWSGWGGGRLEISQFQF